jgi:uncharacterized protein
MQEIVAQIAQEIRVESTQVGVAVALLDCGTTVPSIARYRKEKTDGLDDIQWLQLEGPFGYLRELHDRLRIVTSSIKEHGKMTPALLGNVAAFGAFVD